MPRAPSSLPPPPPAHAPRLSATAVAALAALLTLVSSALPGCAARAKNEPSVSTAPSESGQQLGPKLATAPAPSSSASSAAPELAAQAALPNGPEDVFPRGPTLLAGPFRLDRVTGAPTADCEGMQAYAFYGDPETRVLDGVWTAGMTDCSRGYLRTVERIPTATRLVDAFAHLQGVYAVLESVATRAQPAGLRTVVDVADPRPTGIVAPVDRAAVLALLPPARVREAVVYAKDEDGSLASPPPPGARTPSVTEWASPEGLVIEDVFQDHFAQEIARRGPQDALLATVARELRAHGFDCRGGRWDDDVRGVCWHRIGKYDQTAFVRASAGGPTVVRALRVAVSGKRLFGPASAPLSQEQHLATIQAFADRQPVRGTVLAAGPLGPHGGSVGVLFVPSPSPRAYVLRVDGPAMSIERPDPLLELGDALRDGGKLEASVLASPHEPSRLLLRADRAPRRPWTAIVRTRHPLDDERRPSSGRAIVDDEKSVFRLVRASSLAEAEAMVRAPPVRATAAELTELFSTIGDRAHLLAHAAKDAVFIEQPVGTNLGDVAARPLAEVSDDALDELRSFSEERWVRKPIASGDELKSFFEKSGSSGSYFLVLEVWLTREDGKLRVAAVVDR